MSNARGMPGGGMLKLRFDRYIRASKMLKLDREPQATQAQKRLYDIHKEQIDVNG